MKGDTFDVEFGTRLRVRNLSACISLRHNSVSLFLFQYLLKLSVAGFRQDLVEMIHQYAVRLFRATPRIACLLSETCLRGRQ